MKAIWKGTASYNNIVVDQDINKNAWYDPDPTKLAQSIIGYIAFWKGVEILDG